MANRFYTDNAQRKLPTPVASHSAPVGSHGAVNPIKTAPWPSLPGPGGPDMSAGVPKTGSMGDFYVYSQFSPAKMSSGNRFAKQAAKKAPKPGY